jgi:hypothetical protein
MIEESRHAMILRFIFCPATASGMAAKAFLSKESGISNGVLYISGTKIAFFDARKFASTGLLVRFVPGGRPA